MPCSQTPQLLSPILEQSTPWSLDSTRIDTPKRTKQAFRGRFLELPKCTSTPVTRTERQSARTPRTPQGRNTQDKQDKFPMTDKRFQRKVLTQLIEIKEELRRIGKNVEPDTVFHLSTLATEEEFQILERHLESENTRAAMVAKLCKIGGKNLKDSARRMLDR
ncbi:uncharacterized protein LOC143749487 isoform X2 [Siphateles boraxobius]|uniref:uncharacterized protein LOC143749487 isoform X2 n=1 Tax=Siphateles boraxobius TaxID=180520 RepID=UPI004062D289